MSRYDDGYDGDGPDTSGIWAHTLKRVLLGERGQRILAGLEEALLAMPEKRLAEGVLACDGQVCAVGAFYAYKRHVQQGETWRQAIAATETEIGDEYASEWETTEVGKQLGLGTRLAFEIGYQNDETARWDGAYTPEARYAHVLAWVQQHRYELSQ